MHPPKAWRSGATWAIVPAFFLLAPLHAAETDPASLPKAASAPSDTRAANGAEKPPSFKTPEEAIEFYQIKLGERPLRSMVDLNRALTINLDADAAQKIASMDGLFVLFANQAGKLRDVETLRVLELGKHVRRVGYLLFYEHNLLFADIWFVDTTTGWRFTEYNCEFDTDSGKKLRKIPEIFFK
jgi:hypothetical protein